MVLLVWEVSGYVEGIEREIETGALLGTEYWESSVLIAPLYIDIH